MRDPLPSERAAPVPARDGATFSRAAASPALASRLRQHRRALLPGAGAVAIVMAGGAAGTAARYGIGQRFPVDPGTFPTATLAENLAGAALLGFLLTLLVARGSPNAWIRPLLATGMLGSFTTFSTFATEVVLLLRDGRVAVALAYVTATLALGVTAAALGVGTARRWTSPRRRGARP